MGNYLEKRPQIKLRQRLPGLSERYFLSVRLLRASDFHTGALNDTGMDHYAKIEAESGLTNAQQGSGMLHNRWKITQVQNIVNAFVKYLFQIRNDPKKPYGDLVKLDSERAFQCFVGGLGSKEKAIREGIEWAITGNGAKIYGTKKATQIAIGFKVTDMDAIDPITGEPSCYTMEEDADGIERIFYKDSQKTNTCIPIRVCLHAETDTVVRDCFGPQIRWYKKVVEEGLDPSGDEPAFAKGGSLVGCRDMCFLQKIVACGGACKVKTHFLSVL